MLTKDGLFTTTFGISLDVGDDTICRDVGDDTTVSGSVECKLSLGAIREFSPDKYLFCNLSNSAAGSLFQRATTF